LITLYLQHLQHYPNSLYLTVTYSQCSDKRWNPRKDHELRAKRTRYQQGSIKMVPRAKGFAWEARFSDTVNDKRTRKAFF